jgi:hypothetical protein
MYFKLRPKRVPKLGDSLRGTVTKKFLWKAIDAGRVGIVFEQLSKDTKELRGSHFVSWKDNVIKVKVGSSVQRQEIILKQEKLKEELRKKGINAKEIKIVY